ncbi:acyl-CoA--sterol O-acyltransferase 1 [Cicer arietinum]|uniref:Acyl-CoA--sterol O-acyltransferase 1 n=1 Tax=Cicer arietinum TaxID=3827 RepID=A0A1S2Z7L4_CICAR|nr:acyl-CoA--sterol O-acyltransferase 1 [Cicer arietinum]
MESNMLNLIKVYPLVIISLYYCYWIRTFVQPGTKRLTCFLPIICLNLFIPLTFSSVHLTGTLGFFFAWLTNFKLLCFAFNKGPLSSDSSISLPLFLALACLPIKIQQKKYSHDQNGKTKTPSQDLLDSSKSSNFETKKSSKTLFKSTPFLQYAIKGILLGVLVKIYDYSDYIHPKIIWGMYCFHVYFTLEIMLATIALLAQKTLGLELEPQFNNPIISTSLQDFWGRRWNLIVTSILRPTVYEPTLKAAKNVIGPKWAPLPAVLGTFVVSGLMHELILFYLGRLEPTFKMMGFFVLHGVCLTVEIGLKKFVTDRWRLPKLVSRPLTVGFVFATCFWLFLPEFIRCRLDVKAFEEYAALGAYVRNLTSVF